MNDADRFGPYPTPAFRYGDVVICDVRGQVELCGLTKGPIPWPVGKRDRRKAIVVCAGQESERGIATDIAANGQTAHVIGGARLAGELDAKRAIYEGAILGNRI